MIFNYLINKLYDISLLPIQKAEEIIRRGSKDDK